MKPNAHALGQFRQTNLRLIGRRTARKKRGCLPAIERMEARELLAAAFLAPAEPSGSVNLQLVPLANVTPGVQEIVTFGMPFTLGSVTVADLAKIRVLKNGVEIPAFVEQLTPWRSIDNPSVDGQSVRVARIQIPYTFTALTSETITVQWGGPARTLNRPSLQDPRLEWHTVTSGTFVAGDNVEEPDVLPVLPGAYLSKGMLDSQTVPTNSNVAETRDDPAVMDTQTFTGYQEYDYAEKNFFYTIINQNPGITIDYKTQAEPWLYDRSSAMYELYFRSGSATALREAVRSTDFYLDHLDGSGFFTLKPGDPKYAYNESLAYTYWLLGDNRVLPEISTVVNAHSSTATRWSPNLNFFTERNAGYKLLANEMAYEVTGGATFKNNVQTIVNDLIFDQNGAGGQLPANRIDGGLYHTGAQHDISEASSGSVIIASPWMSALVVDPMVRVYGVWQNNQVADFIVRMGNFEKAASKTDADGQFGGTTRYPDYLMRFDGTSDSRSDTDVQHAMDVGGAAAWATYFAELRGTPDASLRQLANDLYATYDVGVNFWTRPGGTNFNVSPPRRYAWEYKNSASFSWALTATSPTTQPGTLQLSSATYSVNENQASMTIIVNRINGSSGAVSVNYATSNGSATAGSDYTAVSGTLMFLDGETSKTFTIPIINDTAVEGNETVNVTLSNPTGGASLGAPTTATLTIVSDDVAPAGALQFSTAGYTANETQGTATITVTRTNGSAGAVSVSYATSNGTATAGSDYTAASGTLNFADGETSKTFTIAIINDTSVENPETVNLTLSSPTGGATLGAQSTAVLTINSDDVVPQPGTLQFSASGTSVNEIQGTATITVTRTNGSSGSVTVNYATSNGTATAGSDYTAASGTLTFLDGETSKTFTIPIINDTAVENPETINLTLSSPTGGATLGAQSTAVLTINSDDTSGQPVTATFQQGVNGYTGTTDVTITTQYTQYTGGNGTTFFDGTQLGVYQTTGSGSYMSESLIRFSSLGIPTNATVSSATITVTVENWVGSPTIRGYYLLAPWSTTAGPSSSQLGWLHRGTGQNWTTPGALGQGTDVVAGSSFLIPGIKATGPQSITINLDPAIVQSWINNPNADQGILLVNETPGAIVRINASENAAANTRPQLRVTYSAGDSVPQPGTLQLSAATYNVNENQGTATITVTRTNGSAGAVSVNYATSNGTATAGSDYTAASGTLNFADGETSKTFTIPIINDTAVENPETVNLTLSSPGGGATLGAQNTAVLTINSDDVAPVGALQFSTGGYTVNETQGTATITVTRTNGSAGAVSVNYATSNGSATAGSDYTATSGTLNFAAGETSKTFTVPIINDTAVENPETVNLTLSSPTGGATLGAQSTAVLTINSDDVAPAGALQFNTGSYTVNENGGTITITVTRTNGSAGTVSVNYATSDGTATAGSDYTATSGTLNFAAGETSKTFTVPITNDTLQEGNETFAITLSSPTGGATLGSPITTTVTVNDDDSTSGVVLPPGFTQSVLTTGITEGTSLAVAPDGRVFVVEQGGAVKVIKNGTLLPTPALTVQTISESERGLLSIAFDPNFATNGFVYVYYTVGGPSPAPAHNRVSRFTLNGDTAVPGSETVLLELPNTNFRIHNGGAMKFGPDGKLYIAVGNDVDFNNAQDLTKPFGKILRINADGTIPTDNPFFSQTTGVNRAIWAIGLRNPYTFDFQPGTGLMYINDVGESSWEEINQGQAGANYGWPATEGYTTNPAYQSPVFAYGHGAGLTQGFAIVGGAFYNPANATFPSQYVGKYFFMDFVNGWIDYVDPTAPNPKTPTNFASNIPVRFDGGPVDLDVGPDGALYYLDRFGGGVFKIQFTATAPSITQQPASQTVNVGQAATFTVTASSTLPISYQWQKMDSGTTTWVNIASATTATFTLGTTTAADNGDQFRCLVSNSAGSTTSSAATLTVTVSVPSGTFTKITASSGVEASVNNNPPGWMSGLTLVDLDGDGDLDFFVSSHGTDDSIALLNNGSGTFTRVTGNYPKSEIHLPADINEDGKIDLTMTFQDGGAQWWINNSTPNNLNFTATNITRQGNTGRTQTFLDINKDGKADWIRGSTDGIHFDLGNGAGSFTEDAAMLPISGQGPTADAQVRFVDIDGDGDDDLVTEWGQYENVGSFSRIYRNDGNLHFTDITAQAGLPSTEGFAVKGVGDVDQDGDTDLIVIENRGAVPQIYLNNGAGQFTKKAGAVSGVPGGTLSYASWGLGVVTDFDNDGIADIIIAGKFYLRMLRGTGGGNFTYMNNAWGIRDTAAMSVDDGYAFGDIDGDGDLDVIGYRDTFPDRTIDVYRNDLASNNWLNVRPIGLPGNVGAGGAKIRIYAAGTNQLLWYEDVQNYDSQVAQSYYAYGETERHFGLGNRTHVDVEVTFYSSGRVARVNNVAANQTVRVLESTGAQPAAFSQSTGMSQGGTNGVPSAPDSAVSQPSMLAVPLAPEIRPNKFQEPQLRELLRHRLRRRPLERSFNLVNQGPGERTPRST